MSRSRKKNPIFKDNGSWGFYRKLSHHSTRANVRNTLSNKQDYNEMIFPGNKARELVNQYSVCDYKWSPLYWYNHRYITDYGHTKDISKYYRK